MPDHEISLFTHGVQNLYEDENVEPDAAEDESNWVTQDGRLKLVGGRAAVGAEGAAGEVQGEIFGYKIDGTKIHWRKISAGKIQYLNGTTWTDVVTGLSTTADYVFANYASLAGTFTYAFGPDGIFQFHNANPGSYANMYSAATNFLGYGLIDKGRTFLWNQPKDPTGLYGSHIDEQTYATNGSGQSVGTGNGSTVTFTYSLAAVGGGAFAFNIQVYAPIGAAYSVASLTQATQCVLTMSNTAGLSAGQYLTLSGFSTNPQFNGLLGEILSVTPTTVTLNLNTSTITGSSSAGTVTLSTLYKDDLLGNITGIGTVNYCTGQVSITLPSAPASGVPIPVFYQISNSNNGGVTDFTHSSPRVAGEGFTLRQDEGGDAILNVLIGPDGAYYSMKRQSAYQLTLDNTDLSPTNIVFRRNIGVPSLRGSIATNKGIAFINTANIEHPEFTLLSKNPVSNFVEPTILFPQFKFANYDYSDCNFDTWERYTIIMCKSLGSAVNDTILLADFTQGSIDIISYNARTSATDSGNLYIGSSITQSVYEIFNGFDDNGLPVQNYWTGAGSVLRPLIKLRRFVPTALKKVRTLKLRGMIDGGQWYQVFISFDDAGFQLVGTIRGDGPYVDQTQPQLVGAHFMGQSDVGGGETSTIYPYFTEIKLKTPKFRKRTIKIIAGGIGYVDIDFIGDHVITAFEDRLPKRYRQKQYVSLDGTENDLSTPQF